MPRNKRWRAVFPYLILLAVLIAVISAVHGNRIRQNEMAEWETQVLASARFIESSLQPQTLNQEETGQLNQVVQAGSESLSMKVLILNTQGEVLAKSLDENVDPEQLESMLTKTRSDGKASQKTKDQLSAATTILDEAGKISGFVYLEAPRENFRATQNWLLWFIPAILLINAWIIWFITRIFKDRLRRHTEMLTIAAEQMSMGNFKRLHFPETESPLNDLAQALKVMAEHIGNQIDALTSERARLTAVLNQMTDGVLIADSNGRVQLLNPAAERLFQVGESEGVGRSVVEVLRYHQLVDLWRQTNQGKNQSTMLEIGPQHLFLQVVGIPLKTSLPGNTMILFQDLTQLRRLETVRRDFISNVSHELRTPLASLKALAETLQEGALDDPPAARRFILRMETEIDNLTQLVNELLELSRIESGKVPLSFHRIQPCDLLNPAYERMYLQAERAGLELSIDCQQELPSVFADPTRITQVMINLIHNAIKFTPPGGNIQISARKDGEFIVFAVKDTGVGIARRDLGRIFERFYKADRARTGGGTGLGLSIARHMIESHGGYIWAESEEGVGSTIYFSLPVA